MDALSLILAKTMGSSLLEEVMDILKFGMFAKT